MTNWEGQSFLQRKFLNFWRCISNRKRILIAGQDEGVWSDYPECSHLIPEIHAQNYPELRSQIGGSSSTDVTGGMAEKVRNMMELASFIARHKDPDIFGLTGAEYIQSTFRRSNRNID